MWNWTESRGRGAGWGELLLTLWLCPRPREEEDGEEEKAAGLHGIHSKATGKHSSWKMELCGLLTSPQGDSDISGGTGWHWVP